MKLNCSTNFPVNTVRTVSDTKKAFYTIHTRPINSIYRRVVEELLVEMHLLSVNADFSFDAVYALGVVTTFNRFMQGYAPEQDKISIFNALCQAMGEDASKFNHCAEQLQSEASQVSLERLLSHLPSFSGSLGSSLSGNFRQVAENTKFKYSRLFAIGIYTILETVAPDLVKEEQKRNEALQAICDVLKLSMEKVQKDLELYRSNLEKMTQAQIVMEDILKAERKKKEERVKAKDAIATPQE
jgi:photosystem II biogenesis protein Psp29